MSTGTIQVKTSKFVSHQAVGAIIESHQELMDRHTRRLPVKTEKLLKKLDRLNLELLKDIGRMDCKLIHTHEGQTYLLNYQYHPEVDARWWVEVEKLIEV